MVSEWKGKLIKVAFQMRCSARASAAFSGVVLAVMFLGVGCGGNEVTLEPDATPTTTVTSEPDATPTTTVTSTATGSPVTPRPKSENFVITLARLRRR